MDNESLVKIAILYYEHDMTHVEIANAIGSSRVKVTRALQEARRRKLVEFIIRDPVAPFEFYERALLDRYADDGLQACGVAPTRDGERQTRNGLGQIAVPKLRQFLPCDGVVALSMSRAVSATVNQLTETSRSELTVAAASGSVARTTSDTSSALAIELARRLGGRAYTVQGPMRPSSEILASLRREPGVADALRVASEATHLVTGVGSMAPGGGRVVDSLDGNERNSLISRGAVGDLASRFFDADGKSVTNDDDDRLLSLTHDQVWAIPKKMVIGAGTGKSEAIATLLRCKQITSLVVDVSLARELISMSGMRGTTE